MNRRPLAALAALAVAPALALVLSSCSADASPSGTASAGSPAAASGAAPTSDTSPDTSDGSAAGADPGSAGSAADSSSAARDAYDLGLAQCIRGKGVDVADPRPGEGFATTGREVQAAASACAAELPPPPLLTAAEGKIVREGYLRTAACLRERGYDVDDPAPDMAIAIENVPQADYAACAAAAQ